MKKHSLSALKVALLSSLTACAGQPADDGDTLRQDLAGPVTEGVCSEPAVSPDGSRIVFRLCATGSAPARLVTRSVAGGPLNEVATIPATAEVKTVATSASGFAVVLSKGESFEIVASQWTASAALLRIDAASIPGASASGPKAIHVTDDGRWLLGVSGEASVFFATRIAAGATTTSRSLQMGSRRHTFASSGSSAVLITGRSETTAVARHISLDGEATVGEERELPLPDFYVLPSTFDGTNVVCSGRSPGGPVNESVVTLVDVRSGQAKVLAGTTESPSQGSPAFYSGGLVRYQIKTRTYDALLDTWIEKHSLYRMGLDGAAPPRPLVEALGKKLRFAKVTPDGTLLYWKERKEPVGYGDVAGDLFKKPLDGSPETKLLENVVSNEMVSVGDRTAISYAPFISSPPYFSPQSYLTTVFGPNGSPVGQIPGLNLYNPSGENTFSGDGTVHYAPFDPNLPLQCESGPQLRVCDNAGYFASGTTFLPIPNNAGVLLFTRRNVNQPGRLQFITP